MAYGRCVIYDFTGDEQDLISRARAQDGIVQIFKGQAGFIAYGVIIKDDALISMSAWDSESNAQQADTAAKDWVSKNTPELKLRNSYMGDYAWLEMSGGQ
jgi:hypothetical protein